MAERRDGGLAGDVGWKKKHLREPSKRLCMSRWPLIPPSLFLSTFLLAHPSHQHKRIFHHQQPRQPMMDWAPVVVGVVLFVVLTPGLLFELPGTYGRIDFGGLRTTGKSIFVHTLVFFTIFAVIILGFEVHIYTGGPS
ncbi:hypothetical protein VPH35_021387 [Triticum aestivum]